LTETGALLGTPAYMSPEQARGARGIDRRADVYSLGATLYELLAGAPPFVGDEPVQILLAVLHDPPTPLRARVPDVPADLDTIVAKCLHKEPGQRYDSARGLAEDLDRYIRGEPILGRREGLTPRLRRLLRRHRGLVVTAALALLGVSVAGGMALQTWLEARRQRAELTAQAELSRELGQDIKEMEWFLRVAYLLPLHDVTGERAAVEERMRDLAARGPAPLVDYALGRGHLALGDDAAARDHLARARDGGLDLP
ncbi:MAG: protein kinase, partial [Myxococcales bacterium]|nr:protein kinase [Myxococcales bacterium]